MNFEFGEYYLEQALCNRLVCGLKHEPKQKHLLSESTLSLAKAIEIAQSIEAAEMNSLKLKGRPIMDVMQVVPDPPRKKVEKKEPVNDVVIKDTSLESVITKILNATSVTK